MTETADLFSHYAARQASDPYNGTAPHVRGSETSRQAAESVTGDLGRLERLVYEFVEARGIWGSTCDEFEAAHPKITHQCASARFRTLELKKRLEKTFSKRKTRSGRSAVVYRARA